MAPAGPTTCVGASRGLILAGWVISIVGAESTGKSTLALALCEALNAGVLDAAAPSSQRLNAQTPDPSPEGVALPVSDSLPSSEALAVRRHRSAHVDETLRSFCIRTGRTPTSNEQVGIAAEQSRRIAVAAAAHDFVIADTSALMTAVYSDYVFGDTSLYDSALATQAGYALTLLTALDLPWRADGLQRDGAHVRQPVDALIRRALQRAGLSWSVVAGQGPDRLANALAAVRQALRQGQAPHRDGGEADQPDDAMGGSGSWHHLCARCGDGDCERRLWHIDRPAGGR